ncbi:MAG TPA: histidine kinase [Thermoanaerobaculia bacterium]|nr:histidine kinase [Thermoanaerobaculia bacterium]
MRARNFLLRALAVALAWLPFLAFWVFFFMAYGGESFREAFPWGLLTIGSAAILGVGVWRFCALNPWPARMQLFFYVRHLVAASGYAAGWILAVYGGEALVRRENLPEMLANSRILAWQFLMGVWLYGLVAGVSYGIQTRRRAAQSERRALRAEAALSGARLEALRSRLNPHFLFNALHTVGALVRQDPARSESAVEKLGDMLRYTLREDPGETVSFRDEWDFTERYVEFEQLRFGERLRVAPKIEPRALECQVPSFALQTLVENAVRHSIATRVEGGRVEIAASVDGQTLKLSVRDDGNASSREAANGGHGYGLRALKERLEAVYGGAASVTTTDSGGYEVSVKMPCEAPKSSPHPRPLPPGEGEDNDVP